MAIRPCLCVRLFEHMKRRERTDKTSNYECTEQIVPTKVALLLAEGLSEQMRRIVSPLGVRVVNKARKWQWMLCKGIKDNIEQQRKAGVFYQASCKDCTRSFVGKPLQLIRTTIDEHRRHSRNGRVGLSAVAECAWMQDLDKVLELRRMSCKVKEALWIKVMKTTMNKDRGVKLSMAWLDLAAPEFHK